MRSIIFFAVAALCATVASAIGAPSVGKKMYPDHTKQFSTFENMADQQYCYGWLDPKINNVYQVRMQCENHQQVAKFDYMMQIAFYNGNDEIYVAQHRVEVKPRGYGSGPKVFVTFDLTLDGIIQKTTHVWLRGVRMSEGRDWSQVDPRKLIP